MPIKPLRDLLYIIPIDHDQGAKTESSLLYKPDSFTQRTNQGIVKYRGPLTTGEVLVGDHVFFPPQDGDEATVESEGRLIILRERDASFLWEGGDGEWLLSKTKVKELLDHITARMMLEIMEHDERNLLRKQSARMIELLDDSQLTKELWF